MKIGIISPGAMGAAVGATLAEEVFYASSGRSAASIERAQAAGLSDCVTLAVLLDTVDIIFSICPPAAAEAQAEVGPARAGLHQAGQFLRSAQGCRYHRI